MSSQANKQLIQKLIERFSGKPKTDELLRQLVADEALIAHSLASESAFPCYRIDPIEMIAEGDLVSIRSTWSGTHLGEFMGVPGTGKTFATPLFVTYRISGGKVVDHWMIIDNADLMRQLGIPQPQATGVPS
jgi:predicted ester cyclase